MMLAIAPRDEAVTKKDTTLYVGLYQLVSHSIASSKTHPEDGGANEQMLSKSKSLGCRKPKFH
jgi:hypothetical protein